MSIELNPYYAASDGKVGTSFRLNAVQVITLVQRGARSAAGHGFAEEDGDDLTEMQGGSFEDETGAGGAASGDDDEL